MILDLVSGDNLILREQMPPFDFKNPPCDPIQLAKDLAETMIDKKGIGLSANQVGLRHRVFALMSNPIFVCFNPRVIDTTQSAENNLLLDEGCLSFPNLFVKIKRPRMIKVRFTQPNGEVRTEKFDGITARCFLHELDHLNGIVYTDLASRFHLDRALRQKKIMDRRINNAKN